jgi:hypothetical protein
MVIRPKNIIMLKKIIISIFATWGVLYGAYLIDTHTESQTYNHLFFSFVVAGLCDLATLSTLILLLMFFIRGYFNGFLSILTLTILVGCLISFISIEKISSVKEFFTYHIAVYSLVALLIMIVLLILKTVSFYRSER